MAKIKVLIPQYLKAFRCIGKDCEDTCCQHWNITIDKNTYKKYKRIGKGQFNPLSQKKSIKLIENREDVSSYAKFVLKEDGTCPFLNERGLCSIYEKLSYDYLPITCKIYPRILNQVDDVFEMALTLSCPEAGRKALLSKEIMEFEFVEFEYQEYMKYVNRHIYTTEDLRLKEYYQYFWDIRMASIDILQNRKFTIPERLILLGMLYRRIESCIAENQNAEIPHIINDFMNIIQVVDSKTLFEDMEENKGIQLFALKVMFHDRAIGSLNLTKKAKEIIEELRSGISALDEEASLDWYSIGKYKKVIEEDVIPATKDFSHMIEHYLVNVFFLNCMPFVKNFETIWYCVVYLCIQYAMIKGFMIGTFFKKGKIEELDIVDMVSMMGKSFEHNRYYNIIMVKLAENLELNTLGGLYVLIHD